MIRHIWDLHRKYNVEDRDNNSICKVHHILNLVRKSTRADRNDNSISEELCIFETPLGVVLGIYTSSFSVVVSMSVSTSHSEPIQRNKIINY